MESGAEAPRAPPESGGRAWRVTRRLSRWLLGVSYARIEVTHAERIPATGAALLVANHTNSLADSLALVLASPRAIAPLAKAPLFQSGWLGPFLRAIDAVPVYREQDVAENAGRGVRANMATFEACRARLRAGHALVLFPEGVSQPQPRLLPLRTGAARIALDAAVPITVVPAGLVFEPPGGRRGGVLVAVGEPFVADGSALAKDERRGAIARLTRQIESALRGLLAEADSQSDLDALRALAEIRRQERGDPEPRTLAARHRDTQALARGLEQLKARDPAAVESLRAQTDAFLRGLAGTGVPLRLLPARYGRWRVLQFVGTTLLPAAVLFPLALLARLVTAPGRVLGDVLALRASGAFEDVRAFARGAGWAMGTAFVAVLLAVVLLVLGRPWWALAAVLGLPLLLALHVRLKDHLHDVKERVRTFFLLAGKSLVGKELLEQRRALVELLEASAKTLAAAPTP
jgi:1-acyl-sn-glycerol-3-phosphate acyltransferase